MGGLANGLSGTPVRVISTSEPIMIETVQYVPREIIKHVPVERIITREVEKIVPVDREVTREVLRTVEVETIKPVVVEIPVEIETIRLVHSPEPSKAVWVGLSVGTFLLGVATRFLGG
jgi:hypothetical protein